MSFIQPSASGLTKTPVELGYMRDSGHIVFEILQELKRVAAPGMSTWELDRIAEDMIYKKGAKPAFKGYRGFPCVLCVSLNDEVVHGIPNKKRLMRSGDIVSLDFGVVFRGFYGDSAITIPIGPVSEAATRLMTATQESLFKGIEQMVEGKRISDIGAAVQKHAEGAGYSVVRALVGHGIGRALHEDPQVPNYDFTLFPDKDKMQNPRLKNGMVLAVEPMINQGTFEVKRLKDGWTEVTADHQLSAHFEHTIAITERGPEILTQ